MNRRKAGLVLAVLVVLPALADTVKFDDVKVGQLPPKWLATQTGNGEAAWSVEKDDSAPSRPNALVQTGEADYPICIKQDTKLKDGFVEVQLKPLAGKEDQAGGIIWHCLDKNNYYIARANALENNVIFFHTIKGKRVELKRVAAKVTTNTWHTLRVEFKGTHVKVQFDGALVLEADDDAIKSPGMIGLWTKADSITAFDNFTYGEIK
jgi:hypothetical protein